MTHRDPATAPADPRAPDPLKAAMMAKAEAVLERYESAMELMKPRRVSPEQRRQLMLLLIAGKLIDERLATLREIAGDVAPQTASRSEPERTPPIASTKDIPI